MSPIGRCHGREGYIVGPDDQFDFFGFGGALAAWIIEEYPGTWPVHVRDTLVIAHRVTRRSDTVVRGRRTTSLPWTRVLRAPTRTCARSSS